MAKKKEQDSQHQSFPHKTNRVVNKNESEKTTHTHTHQIKEQKR